MNDFEKQLHEQYAINANNNLVVTITIACAMLSAIAGFGYVFLHTIGFNLVGEQYAEYHINALLFTAFAAISVLGILFVISTYLGAYQRKEQFITYAIRLKNMNEQDLCIFPKGYNPMEKGCCNFVCGLHNVAIRLYAIAAILIFILTLYWSCCAGARCCHIVIFCLSTLTVIIFCMMSYVGEYNDYLKRESEYDNKYEQLRSKVNNKYKDFE